MSKPATASSDFKVHSAQKIPFKGLVFSKISESREGFQSDFSNAKGLIPTFFKLKSFKMSALKYYSDP